MYHLKCFGPNDFFHEEGFESVSQLKYRLENVMLKDVDANEQGKYHYVISYELGKK